MVSKDDVPTPMEQLFGTELMTEVGGPLKSTKELFENKELVLIYFSASWCPPCKTFSPLLKKFYTAMAKPARLEIIYISSDKDVASFAEYYGSMPWLALPGSKAEVKRSLATQLHVSGIPTLVVLDVNTGYFISDNGRYDVSVASGNETKMIELVQTWKATTPVPLDQAVSSVSQRPPGPLGILSFILKNPIFIFGLYFLVKQAMKQYSVMKNGSPAAAVVDVGGAQESPPVPPVMIDEESEF
jgi:nucleoredoxin